MKMYKSARLTPPFREGMARGVLAGWPARAALRHPMSPLFSRFPASGMPEPLEVTAVLAHGMHGAF